MKREKIILGFLGEGTSLSLIERDAGYYVESDEGTLLDFLDAEDQEDFEPITTYGPFKHKEEALKQLLESYPYAFQLHLVEMDLQILDSIRTLVEPEIYNPAFKRMLQSELPKCVEYFEKNPDYGTWYQEKSDQPNVTCFPCFIQTPMAKKLTNLMYILARPSKSRKGFGWELIEQDLIMEQDLETICGLTCFLQRCEHHCGGAWGACLNDGTILKLAKRYLECVNSYTESILEL